MDGAAMDGAIHPALPPGSPPLFYLELLGVARRGGGGLVFKPVSTGTRPVGATVGIYR